MEVKEEVSAPAHYRNWQWRVLSAMLWKQPQEGRTAVLSVFPLSGQITAERFVQFNTRPKIN